LFRVFTLLYMRDQNLLLKAWPSHNISTCNAVDSAIFLP
jgi:hypothetical protein